MGNAKTTTTITAAATAGLEFESREKFSDLGHRHTEQPSENYIMQHHRTLLSLSSCAIVYSICSAVLESFVVGTWAATALKVS